MRKYKYDITRYENKSEKIKEPIKFAVLADIHSVIDEFVIEKIKEENVDAILIAGDLVDKNCHKDVTNSSLLLNVLGYIAPVFYALGNHEEMYGVNVLMMDNISDVKVIINDDVRFKNVVIGGLAEERPYDEWLNSFEDKHKEFKLLLCHKPDLYIKKLKDRKIDLTISGHAHGGQIRIFNQGLYAPGQGVFPKYTSGLSKDDKLLISRGLCNTAPFFIPRLFNRPEIIFLTLSPIL